METHLGKTTKVLFIWHEKGYSTLQYAGCRLILRCVFKFRLIVLMLSASLFYSTPTPGSLLTWQSNLWFNNPFNATILVLSLLLFWSLWHYNIIGIPFLGLPLNNKLLLKTEQGSMKTLQTNPLTIASFLFILIYMAMQGQLHLDNVLVVTISCPSGDHDLTWGTIGLT